MKDQAIAGGKNAFATLRQLAQPRTPAQPKEQCELCSASVPPQHRHLLERAQRRILCACDGCALTFATVATGRFQLIPRETRWLAGFQIDNGVWEELALPINLAFLIRESSDEQWAAMYPSPAGVTRSAVPLSAWKTLAESNPVLREIRCDVEALLVNRVETARDYFIAPLDRCFELAGLIRTHWRGFSGGDEVWQAIGNYFTALKGEARIVGVEPEASHA